MYSLDKNAYETMPLKTKALFFITYTGGAAMGPLIYFLNKLEIPPPKNLNFVNFMGMEEWIKKRERRAKRWIF